MDAATQKEAQPEPTRTELATFGAGCFWCTEAVFQRMDGVLSVTSGYAGGHTKNPTYKEVCGGKTGHAEVTQVKFDPDRVTFDQLVDLFWQMHDPTTPDRQGHDVGTQYRSVIFYHSDEQHKTAEASRDAANKSGQFKSPVVTEISPASTFYAAENYHQDYFNRNKNAPYCLFNIVPKLKKLDLD